MFIRKIAKSIALKNSSLCNMIEDGFFSVPFNQRLINFVFQRIFNINGKVPFSTHYTSRVDFPDKLIIGRQVRKSFAMSGGCYISALNGVFIGDYTVFAPNVIIQSLNHDLYIRNLVTREKPIRIGENCWIGANTVITAGICIGDHVTIGAGSVVTNDIPDYAIAFGVPCRVIKIINKDVLDNYRHRRNILIPSYVSDRYPSFVDSDI